MVFVIIKSTQNEPIQALYKLPTPKHLSRQPLQTSGLAAASSSALLPAPTVFARTCLPVQRTYGAYLAAVCTAGRCSCWKCLAQSFKEERADRQHFSDNGEPQHFGNLNGESWTALTIFEANSPLLFIKPQASFRFKFPVFSSCALLPSREGQDSRRGLIWKQKWLQVSRDALSPQTALCGSFRTQTSQSLPRLLLTKMLLKLPQSSGRANSSTWSSCTSAPTSRQIHR